jgi:hypothetical protein
LGGEIGTATVPLSILRYDIAHRYYHTPRAAVRAAVVAPAGRCQEGRPANLPGRILTLGEVSLRDIVTDVDATIAFISASLDRHGLDDSGLYQIVNACRNESRDTTVRKHADRPSHPATGK